MATPPPPATTSAGKKPQPIPWTHQETVNLIRAYQEKWYSLKRGPLRSNKWEEVAVVVAARCGYDFAHPSKSALQCRHKIEKLRQRHRAEKHRPATRPWQYFSLMDDLERGPLPISAHPLASLPPGVDEDEEDDEIEHGGEGDVHDHDDRVNYMKSKSVNYILKQRSAPSAINATKNRAAFNVWDDEHDDGDDDEVEEEEEEEEEDEGLGMSESGLVLGLTEEIKAFGERFIGLENLKMEMMKETERFRFEMEKKRMRMILESQRRVVDSIGRAFGSSSSSKRMKITRPI
ncbi:trihelix transcription factor ENAP1-like [Lotus japonicus]|uniref:trihelix transcription factor ENAP1-like n=1 Tax=Lotus japonicus TaxID=34305 RepID=UPI00258ECFD1|nr:trihelix transcription factor ENAP1-like [Lotus japonicus]